MRERHDRYLMTLWAEPVTDWCEDPDIEDRDSVNLVVEIEGERTTIATAKGVTGYSAEQDPAMVAKMWLEDLLDIETETTKVRNGSGEVVYPVPQPDPSSALMGVTRLDSTCTNCNGKGTTSHAYTHPTNPVLDGWESRVCTTCKGTGEG